jgi:hypothetical protein
MSLKCLYGPRGTTWCDLVNAARAIRLTQLDCFQALVEVKLYTLGAHLK